MHAYIHRHKQKHGCNGHTYTCVCAWAPTRVTSHIHADASIHIHTHAYIHADIQTYMLWLKQLRLHCIIRCRASRWSDFFCSDATWRNAFSPLISSSLRSEPRFCLTSKGATRHLRIGTWFFLRITSVQEGLEIRDRDALENRVQALPWRRNGFEVRRGLLPPVAKVGLETFYDGSPDSDFPLARKWIGILLESRAIDDTF